MLNLLQAVVYVAVAFELAGRWAPAAALLGIAAAAQVAGGGLLLAGRGPQGGRIAAVVSLAVVGVLVGLHAQVALFIVQAFTALGAPQGWQLLGIVALALPWVAFFPIWQLVSSRPGRLAGGAAAAALVGFALPLLQASAAGGPRQALAEVDGRAAATWAFARVTGAEAGAPPDGVGPTLLVVSLVRGGELVSSHTLRGAGLAEALRDLAPERQRAAGLGVLVDVGTSIAPLSAPLLAQGGFAFVRPGETGLVGRDRVLGTHEVWRSTGPRNAKITSGVWLPALKLAPFTQDGVTGAVTMKSWLASASGVVAMQQTWSAPPETTPDALLAAALAGGRMLHENMVDDRFAYVIRGPGGERGSGYNFPRHAGGTWFLARLANRTGDPELREAARRGLRFLAENTERLDDGRAYVIDPSRGDGLAWVGTTALALLGAIELGDDPELTRAWALHVASSVDERGVVRGDLDRATASWPDQPQVTYAQGQGLLALAASKRAGVPGVDAALERAADYVDGGYWPMPAARFHMLDEHWMCLASVAADDALGRPAGKAVCDAYTNLHAREVPAVGRGIQPPAGYAGGIAEAFVARAELASRAGESGPYLDRARAYGDLLLSNLYQPTDAPLLGAPGLLVGGFRDRPWELDVRVDAVQHIGCALLGLEQLLRGERLPGAMP